MTDTVENHIVKKFLKPTFGNREFVHSKKITDENAEIYGYKGAVILIKESGDTVLFRIPDYEEKSTVL